MKQYKFFKTSRLCALALLSTLFCLACSTIQSISSAPLGRGNGKNFNGKFNDVLRATRNALKEEGFVVYADRALDSATQMLIAETPPSLFSWGEVVRVIVVANGNNTFLRVLTERKSGHVLKELLENKVFTKI